MIELSSSGAKYQQGYTFYVMVCNYANYTLGYTSET